MKERKQFPQQNFLFGFHSDFEIRNKLTTEIKRRLSNTTVGVNALTHLLLMDSYCTVSYQLSIQYFVSL